MAKGDENRCASLELTGAVLVVFGADDVVLEPLVVVVDTVVVLPTIDELRELVELVKVVVDEPTVVVPVVEVTAVLEAVEDEGLALAEPWKTNCLLKLGMVESSVTLKAYVSDGRLEGGVQVNEEPVTPVALTQVRVKGWPASTSKALFVSTALALATAARTPTMAAAENSMVM